MARSSRPSGAFGIRVDGLDEAVDALKSAQKTLDKERRKANLQVSREVTKWARSGAQSGTKLQRDNASAIRAGATRDVARLRIAAGARGTPTAGANVAFWGTKKKLGWYGGWTRNASGEPYISQAKRAGFAAGPPNAPKWIGNTWQAGVTGQGPYVINDVVAHNLDRIGEMYLAPYGQVLGGGR